LHRNNPTSGALNSSLPARAAPHTPEPSNIEPDRSSPTLMTLLASEIPRPLACAFHPKTKPPAAYPFSTLSHLSKIRRPSLGFPRLQSRIRPSRLPLPGPARQGRNVDVILPTSQCNRIFIRRSVRPAVSLSLTAASSSVRRFIGGSPEPVKRFVTKIFRTAFSPREALSRARQRGSRHHRTGHFADPTAPRWRFARARARGSG
jgi:hypothetical protein